MSVDVKNQPHYTAFKIQPIQFFRANRAVLDFLQMCVIKYVCRYQLKGGREDLLKARDYLDMMIEDWDKEHRSHDLITYDPQPVERIETERIRAPEEGKYYDYKTITNRVQMACGCYALPHQANCSQL